MRHADLIIIVQSYTNRKLEEIATYLGVLRRAKDTEDKILPAFVLVRQSTLLESGKVMSTGEQG